MSVQLDTNKSLDSQKSYENTKQEIPVIDVGPMLSGDDNQLSVVAESIYHACSGIGFMFIVNQGMDNTIVERCFESSRKFFNLPETEKLKVRMNRHQCGYMPPNVSIHNDTFEKRKTATKPQLSEAFKFTFDLDPEDPDFGKNRRFRGHNKWPDEIVVPGLKKSFMEFHIAFENLAHKLLPPLALSLDMPANYFSSFFQRSSSMSRIAYYPPIKEEKNHISLPGQTDISFLSLIPPATRPGLEILTPSGNWIKQPVIPEGILVNTGNTLVRWINDKYIATPHRVLADTNEGRYSNIFFFYPNVDTVLKCLPSCKDASNPEKYPPITFENFHAEYATRNFGYAENWD